MNNHTKAGILMACLSIPLSKHYFALFTYSERKQLIEIIVHMHIFDKKEEEEAVRTCLELISGERLPSEIDYRQMLHQFAEEKEQTFLYYLKSLIQSSPSPKHI